MPKGPQGQRRPADLVGCAVKVARMSVGDETECIIPKSGRARSGLAGAKARMESLTKEGRVKIARRAAETRWKTA